MSILNILIIASCLLSCICFRICSCLFTFWLGLKAYFETIFGAHSFDPMQGPIKAFFVLFWNPFVGPISAYVQPELNRPSTDLLAQQKQDLAPFIFPGTRPRFMHADLVVHVPSTLFSIFTCMASLHDSPTCSARLCPHAATASSSFFLLLRHALH